MLVILINEDAILLFHILVRLIYDVGLMRDAICTILLFHVLVRLMICTFFVDDFCFDNYVLARFMM